MLRNNAKNKRQMWDPEGIRNNGMAFKGRSDKASGVNGI